MHVVVERVDVKVASTVDESVAKMDGRWVVELVASKVVSLVDALAIPLAVSWEWMVGM